MTQAELNKNAVKSIFAIDDAKAQLESFGSQLDLGLPPEEDFEPKGFDELMTVNPSTDPNYGDSSEKFADLGDDLQDEQTQKFVIDKFAEEAAKRPGTTITAADITDICGAVQCAQLAQGGSIIKGDLVGFIKDTIAKAKNAQQSQNVSDAQPNGTVADDIAPAAGEDAAAPAEDPNAVGGPAPTMEPLEPTVEPTEPSLEPNVDDGLGADPLAADDGLGALDTGIEDAGAADGLGADLGVEDKPAPEDGAAELDAGGLDGLDDLDKDLGDIEADDDLGLEDDAAPAEGGDAAPAEGEAKDEPKAEPKADESKDDGKDESKDEGKDDKKEDKDDDFDFEAVAKKAQALTEGEAGAATEVTEPAAAAEETAKEEAIPEGEATVTEEAGADAGTDVQVNEECGGANGGAKADEQIVQEGFNAEDAEAKVEAIAKEFRSNRIAEKVQAQIEAYEAKEKKAKTIAQIESVMSNFVKTEKSRDQKAQVESIVANFAQASKAAAEKAQLEAEAAKTSELKGKLDSILESVEVKEKAEPVVESVTAAPEKKSDAVGETIAMVEAAMAQMKADEDAAKAKLESIVSDATKRSEGDNLQKELDAIVESVRNA